MNFIMTVLVQWSSLITWGISHEGDCLKGEGAEAPRLND